MKQEFADWPCSVARAAGVFGDSWTLLILRDAMYGLTRYDEFQRSLHIARNTLSEVVETAPCSVLVVRGGSTES
jgi:DNA-binding HxlR family transcriptional regulator